ncbi:Vps38p SKDI_12G3870 [Saccharomyces kudriavzevii IFO 1802]|uniref:Uncharacterized protein n=2 Tax=Saccharomyces kudriavzevii (strain ATCC MYA-4449 / AS 2.2408 / CBS 8840 / NBRC 1802 / NCYC 2889) TaxID=226230 RepID=A0AA35J2Y4_SACK1|nr:uncharacterized protein SKDI_12G3870 [Saccharomyces kudriavzevii IFO 1802]EJT43486.1 VPS38-like protein [Saccharomyces kudriavzevii IFO 1802]CAI4046914.1 hypothetical protein SKDI_12G3870 [Saccharomyces kudriavzevii IFO 1802]
MKPFLSSRRQRHVRAICFHNVSLFKANGNSKFMKEHADGFVPCFFILKSIRGELLYVSEVQSDSLQKLSFQEIPKLNGTSAMIILNLVGKVPSEILRSISLNTNTNVDDKWCVLCTYKIDLNKLQFINEDAVLITGTNTPVLELVDGCYTLPTENVKPIKEPIGLHKRNISEIKLKYSLAYSSLLKLNKLLEYSSQVHEEINEISTKIEESFPLHKNQHKWYMKTVQKSIETLLTKTKKKSLEMTQLEKNGTISHSKTDVSLISQDESINDDYGSIYSRFVQIKDRLDQLRFKKLFQLVGIFASTGLFDTTKGYIHFEGPSSIDDVAAYLKLKPLDIGILFGQANESTKRREHINSQLGYYLLFLYLAATQIFKAPLPYKLMYYGSTSVIEGQYPLYFTDSMIARHQAKLIRAIRYFNANILQFKQFLENYCPT